MRSRDHFDERRPRERSSQAKKQYLGEDAFHGVPIQCQYCSGQSFRRSSLRGDDFTQFLLMRYPVRCLRCSQRQAVSFTVAGISLSSKIRPKRTGRGGLTTGAWAEPVDPLDASRLKADASAESSTVQPSIEE